MHKINKIIFLFLGLGLILPFIVSGSGYQIKFRVKGLKDTTCLIATYYGNGTYVKDTLKVDGSGRFNYKPNDDAPKGIYIVVITEKNYFEFIIDKDQKFSMETELQDLSGKMVVSGTPENRLFYEYLKYNRDGFDEMQVLQDQEKKFKDEKDSVRSIEKRMNALNEKLIRYKLDLAKKNPDSFVAFFIRAMQEPEIPETPVLPNGRKDSTFVYRYYQSHYWDGTDFTDERLLHTPVFHSKLKKYFEKVIVQNPDSIISHADLLIEKARGNKEMFKYLIWFVTYTYENSEIMGFDKVFVHVVYQYYIPGQVTWLTPAVLENIIKKGKRLRPLLLGEVAPNMVMVDTLNQLVSMHDIKADYLLLLFWDPSCGHCETEIPKLKEFYDRQKDSLGIKIFTICSDTNLVKWKETIRKRKMNWINVDGPRTLTGDYHDQYDISSTPVIYLLDSKKIILAKHLLTEQIYQFLKNYQRQVLRK